MLPYKGKTQVTMFLDFLESKNEYTVLCICIISFNVKASPCLRQKITFSMKSLITREKNAF